MRCSRAWPQAWQAKHAGCQPRRSPAGAAHTPYSPGLSGSLHCRAGGGGGGLLGCTGAALAPSFPPGSSTPTPT